MNSFYKKVLGVFIDYQRWTHFRLILNHLTFKGRILLDFKAGELWLGQISKNFLFGHLFQVIFSFRTCSISIVLINIWIHLLFDQFVRRFNIASWSNDFLLKNFLINYLDAWRAARGRFLNHICCFFLGNWWTAGAHANYGSLFLVLFHFLIFLIENFRSQETIHASFATSPSTLIPFSFLGWTLVCKAAHSSSFFVYA